jgi:hypothetical protein
LRKKSKTGIEKEGITFEKVTAQGNKNGLTDTMIDPLKCNDCDPIITVLSGGYSKDPGWSVREFANKNNHSLVVRVDFGKSSFLFTGDLEIEGIKEVLNCYRPTGQSHNNLLDTDILRIGHQQHRK